MPHPITSEFDIIFAGGGSTACVVAGRLAALHPSLTILILEGGQHTLNQAAHVRLHKFTTHLVPTSTTMTFNDGNLSPRLNGRAPIVQCAHYVGGGSSVNAMRYTRGPASDFDDWGAEGWESENLIPLMKKLETYQVQPDRPTHGYGEPIKVSSCGCKLVVSEEFIHVGTTYHKRQYVEDTDDLETCNTYSVRHLNFFLHVWSPLTRFTSAMGERVKHVIFQDKRAVGVEFASDPVSCPDADQSSSIVKASKLIVISAGTFGSPAILERSGIGAEAILKRCNIKPLVDLPGVGESYQDHNLVFASYFAAEGTVTMDPLYLEEENDVAQKNLAQWKIDGKSLVAQNSSDAKIKWRPDDDELKATGSAFQPRWKEFFQDRPDKPVALLSLCAGSAGFSHNLPRRKYIAANYFTLYPVSADSIHIKLDENGQEGIDFNAGFLDDPSDIVPLILGYKKTREIIRRMPSYRSEVPMDHPHFPQGSAAVCGETIGPVDLNAPDIIYTAEDDNAIDRYLRCVQTTWHSVWTAETFMLSPELRTCAMKPRTDQGVIDARLNVYGVTNLEVADMSIAPINVGTNTYWTALLIGEKAAMIIADELGIECQSSWKSPQSRL
ncbi:hypothetical protein C8R48DRAFT_785654 [Suillus tomentosus]|nr:hypothetical protein C8R48DRAFT_785654 [Suillus tomentosus]